MLKRLGMTVMAGLTALTCQDYMFETRPTELVRGYKITQAIATVTPTDILFVVDNSGYMKQLIGGLKANVANFVTQMANSDVDYQIAVAAIDIQQCIPVNEGCHCATCGTNCFTDPNASPCQCGDVDANSDGIFESSNCDAGRLRAGASGTRVFKRLRLNATDAERQAWVNDFASAIPDAQLGVKFAGGLEVARRVVDCALLKGNWVGGKSCPDKAIADLDSGFLRDNADLVLVFMTAKEDCSACPALASGAPDFSSDNVAYNPPSSTDWTNLANQGQYFCDRAECYMISPYTGAGGIVPSSFYCTGDTNLHSAFLDAGVTLPQLTSVTDYLNEFLAAKGGDVKKVRAAAIMGAVPDANAKATFGYGVEACYSGVSGPSNNCGCLAAESANGPLNVPADDCPTVFCPAVCTTNPVCPGTSPGTYCTAMPGGRYMDFLTQLSTARVKAGAESDTLVDSICRADYSQTLYDIVNTVILSNCFDLVGVPDDVTELQVSLNGQALPNVLKGSDKKGWSWIPGTSTICLEGGLTKHIGDEFDILFVQKQ
jgi:hypothetical protein